MTSAKPSVYCLCLWLCTLHGHCHRHFCLLCCSFFVMDQVLLWWQMNEWSAAGKVQSTWNESSREQMVHGGKGLHSAGFICSRKQKFPGMKVFRERKFPGTNGPVNKRSRERSRKRKFHHGNKSSREQIVLRTNVPAFWCMTIFNLI